MSHTQFDYDFPISFAPEIADLPPEEFTRVARNDYEAMTRKRIAEYLKDKPVYMALLAGFKEPATEIENTAYNFIKRFWKTYARGDQLTILGKIVGQPREGRNDYEMLRAVNARILINQSSGTIDEIYEILEHAAQEGAANNARIFNHPPKSFTLSMPGGVSSVAEANSLARLIGQVTDAGVHTSFVYSKIARKYTFTFDGVASQGFDRGLFATSELVT